MFQVVRRCVASAASAEYKTRIGAQGARNVYGRDGKFVALLMI